MFAERLKGNVAREDELVVALVVRERREIERLRCQQLRIGTDDPTGRLAQMLRRAVAPERDEKVSHRLFGRGNVDRAGAADCSEMLSRSCRNGRVCAVRHGDAHRTSSSAREARASW